MALRWADALSWRLGRHLLDPVGSGAVEDVVGRLGAVPAWPDLASELAIGMRRRAGRVGDVAAALEDDRVVKVFAFRGATHLMTPGGAGAFMAVRSSSRMWELPSWESYYGLAPAEWPRFREYVRGLLNDGPITRSALAAGLGRSTRYRHLQDVVADGNDTLLKPLCWQGDLSLGQGIAGEQSFQRLDQVAGWTGLPDLDAAGREVITAHLYTNGPLPEARIFDWFGNGLGAKKRDVRRWLAQLADRLTTVTIEGDEVLLLHDDLEGLASRQASEVVRMLPGRDTWVMAPGSKDSSILSSAHRDVVSRFANLVVHDGRVAGTWVIQGDRLRVTWLADGGPAPTAAIEEEGARLSRFLAKDLDPDVGRAAVQP